MDTCYIYAADIFCNDCGADIVQTLVAECFADDGDSCNFPQMELIGESDTPQHCARCGCFLDNPLTHDGLAYVQRALDENTGKPDVLRQWAKRYGFSNARVLRS